MSLITNVHCRLSIFWFCPLPMTSSSTFQPSSPVTFTNKDKYTGYYWDNHHFSSFSGLFPEWKSAMLLLSLTKWREKECNYESVTKTVTMTTKVNSVQCINQHLFSLIPRPPLCILLSICVHNNAQEQKSKYCRNIEIKLATCQNKAKIQSVA